MAAAVAAALLVSCSTTPHKSPEQAASDQALASRVYSALNADPEFYFRHVDVKIDSGVAYLSGSVWSTSAIERARQIALGVPGVTQVRTDHLGLERNERSGGAR